jgi:hypothetical protein
MADLSKYEAVIDQAINKRCEEIGMPREVLDAAVEADRAAMAPRREAEARFAEDVWRRQERYGVALAEMFAACPELVEELRQSSAGQSESVAPHTSQR